MTIIIGGAYQGKLDYVKENFNIKKICKLSYDSLDIDFECDVIYGLHRLIFAQSKEGIDSLVYVKENFEKFQGKILICDDISCGIVPLGVENRIWREMVGKSLVFLSKESDRVIRVFCGIGTDVK